MMYEKIKDLATYPMLVLCGNVVFNSLSVLYFLVSMLLGVKTYLIYIRLLGYP